MATGNLHYRHAVNRVKAHKGDIDDNAARTMAFAAVEQGEDMSEIIKRIEEETGKEIPALTALRAAMYLSETHGDKDDVMRTLHLGSHRRSHRGGRTHRRSHRKSGKSHRRGRKTRRH